jgi:hypothetical protein
MFYYSWPQTSDNRLKNCVVSSRITHNLRRILLQVETTHRGRIKEIADILTEDETTTKETVDTSNLTILIPITRG